MNINQVKYFVSVFEQQSFSLAARERNVSVQAVSKSINDLEREVGQKLFERSGHGAAPTQLGRKFYQKARLALKAFSELEAFAEGALANAQQSVFRAAMCAPKFQNSEALSQQLSAFVLRNTGFHLQLCLASPKGAVDALLGGTYDALITIGEFENSATDCVCVGSLPTGVQISKNHPLAAQTYVTLENLSEYPAGFSPLYDEFNESILKLYKKRGVLGEVRRVESVAEEDLVFMEQDQGYFFSAMFPTGNKGEEDLVLRPIEPKDNITVPICLVTAKDTKAPNYQAIKSFLVNTVRLLQK